MQEAGGFFFPAELGRATAHFERTEPGTGGDERSKRFIALRDHGAADLVGRRFKFLAQGEPIILIGKVGNAFATDQNICAHPECAGQRDDIFARIFDLLAVLRFDRDVSVGDERAEIKCRARPGGIGRRYGLAVEGHPVRLAGLVDGGKKFRRAGHGERGDAFCPRALFRRQLRRNHGKSDCRGEEKDGGGFHLLFNRPAARPARQPDLGATDRTASATTPSGPAQTQPGATAQITKCAAYHNDEEKRFHHDPCPNQSVPSWKVKTAPSQASAVM